MSEDPWRCTFGTGLLRCFQPRSLVPEYGHPELCFWHAKRAAGVMACDGKGCAKPLGHRPPCSPVRPERMTSTADGLFSDEHTELLRLLRRESA